MDKYRGITRLPLAESRINHLLGRLSGNKAAGSYSTQEGLIRAYADISSQIIKGFDKRVYNLPKATKGTPVNQESLNLYLLGLYSEILYMLDAVKNTAAMTEENFNFAIAKIRNLQSGIKYCKQNLSVFALYATQFDNSLHFGETFSNEVNIDRGSDLLGQQECFVDLAEGNISLPRIEESDVWQIKKIQVGAQSNGFLGSNVEKGTPVRGSIGSLFDGNVDTWTEYERVVIKEDTDGLKLELKIILEDVQPVNGIKIHPIFLGARTPFSIRTIEVSRDGRQWDSLNDEVRVADFLDEDPEERFHLSPHSSKFAGEFNITFAPRFIKFIRLVVRQTSTFPIFDINNERYLRYAIAIKEIEVYGHKYAALGELVSKPIPFNKNISALGMSALVDPPGLPPEVGDVEFFISYDDGASWSQITTLEQADVDIPEVLLPPANISSIRYKLHLNKDELAFSQQARRQNAKSFVEKFGWSNRRPFNLNLLYKPDVDSISVCDPDAATRGKTHPRTVIGNGVTSSLTTLDGTSWERHGNTQLRVRLPLRLLRDPSTIFLSVNGQVWSRISDASNFTDYQSKEYVLERDLEENFWEAVFGNDSTSSPLGRIPDPSDEISLYLSEEKCTVEGFSEPYSLKLDYPSDGIKENTLVRFSGKVDNAPSEQVPSNVTKFKLAHENIFIGRMLNGQNREFTVEIKPNDSNAVVQVKSNAVSYPSTGSFREYKSFVDGYSELSTDGDWTVDIKEGVLYLNENTPTEESKEVTLNYYWEKIIDLEPQDWDFVDGKLDEIHIYKSGYKTRGITRNLETDLGASAGGKSVAIFDTDNNELQGIVAKSLRILGGELNGERAFEIPFIDGAQEFRGRARIRDEEVPSVTSIGTPIARFELDHGSEIVTSSSPSFSDESYFTEPKGDLASLTTQGDYFFDGLGVESWGSGYIHVHMGGVGVTLPSGITVSYQYNDAAEKQRFKGAYSIDSAQGILYFATALSEEDIKQSINFKYTPYIARYNISSELEKDKDYEVIPEDQTIRVLAGASGSRERNLVVRYKYQPEQLQALDLAPYFSPLVRAIDIKVS